MALVEKLKEAFQFEYTCAGCGKRLRDGDRFAIVGTMTGEKLRGCVTNTVQQIAFLGHMLCGACARDQALKHGAERPPV